ncbi:MAG TPA: hypothetical protein VIH87_00135, partial [Methylocella sp.]
MSERDKARSATSGAAKRWPFELLQNAHDPGPRAGSKFVDVNFNAAGAAFIFQHNGRPFTGDDLAALLSGGSNKEYDDSADTTGRYGTGFLVTHVPLARGNGGVPTMLKLLKPAVIAIQATLGVALSASWSLPALADAPP